MNMKLKSTLLGSLLAVAAVGASAQNLITNGDFESNLISVADGTFETVFAGQGWITDWTVGLSSVDLIRSATWGSIDSISVDLAGTPGAGSISQDFSVIAGMTYNLTFDLARNGAGTDLQISFGDITDVVQMTDFGGVPTGGASVMLSYDFTAASTGTATLMFASAIGAGDSGPVIDNVSVTAAVPEPGTYALMFAGLGMIGMLARRRKNR